MPPIPVYIGNSRYRAYLQVSGREPGSPRRELPPSYDHHRHLRGHHYHRGPLPARHLKLLYPLSACSPTSRTPHSDDHAQTRTTRAHLPTAEPVHALLRLPTSAKPPAD